MTTIQAPVMESVTVGEYVPTSQRRSRFGPLDIARGAAMVLACLSHFATRYLDSAGAHAAASWLSFVAHAATPTFFIISGANIGYLATVHPDSFDRLRRKLVGSALFLLTAGHLLILGAHLPSLTGLDDPLPARFVTDTIALALLLSPLLVKVSPMVRIVGALIVYAISCSLFYMWEPSALGWTILQGALVGEERPGFWVYNVAILPWLAVHAAATVFGAVLANSASSEARARVERMTAITGAVLIATALALKPVRKLAVSSFKPDAETARVAQELGSPWFNSPPSPGFMLLFGGLALIVIAAVLVVERLGLVRALTSWLAVLGQASLFAFILQFYVFYAVIPLLVPPSVALSPIIFVASMLFIGACTRLWLRRRGPRPPTSGGPSATPRWLARSV